MARDEHGNDTDSTANESWIGFIAGYIGGVFCGTNRDAPDGSKGPSAPVLLSPRSNKAVAAGNTEVRGSIHIGASKPSWELEAEQRRLEAEEALLGETEAERAARQADEELQAAVRQFWAQKDQQTAASSQKGCEGPAADP